MVSPPPRKVIKAARAILDWSQQDLAEKSDVALSTLSRFESGGGLSKGNYERLLKALATAGISFTIENNKVVGMRFPEQGENA